MKTHALICCFAALVVSIHVARADDRAPYMELVGKDVPDFNLPGMDGKMVSRADLKGQVYVLDFWVTWCAAVRHQESQLDELYRQEKGNGLKMFAINVQEDKEKVKKFVSEIKLTIPVLLDSKGETTTPFKTYAMPEIVVVGKDGKVVMASLGFQPEQIKKAVEEAMKK